MSSLHTVSRASSHTEAIVSPPAVLAPTRSVRPAASRRLGWPTLVVATIVVISAIGVTTATPSMAAQRADRLNPLAGQTMPGPLRAIAHWGAISSPASFGSGAIVQVFKSDGSVQCGGPGIGLRPMADQLAHAGVQVIAMRKTSDGLLHPDYCGAPSGLINVFEINATGLSQAIALGFANLSSVGGH